MLIEHRLKLLSHQSSITFDTIMGGFSVVKNSAKLWTATERILPV